MCLYLDFLSCSTDLYFCFCASNMLSWLLKLCGIVWSQGAWILQLLFSVSRLLWLFRVLCISIKIVQLFCSNSVKNAIDNLTEIALNLYIALGGIVILTISILPIQKYGVSPEILVSSLISFISISQFSNFRSFASLCRFILISFILFWCNSKWDCFLDFSFWSFILSVQEYQLLLLLNHFSLAQPCATP